MTFVHRPKLKKRRHVQSVFRSWLDRDNRGLPSDSWQSSAFSCSCTNTATSSEMCVPSLSRFVIAPCRGLLQALAKVRPVTVHAVTRCTLLASLSLLLLLSPPVVVHSSCPVLNTSTFPRVSLCFAPMFTTSSDNCLFLSVLHIQHGLDSTDVVPSCSCSVVAVLKQRQNFLDAEISSLYSFVYHSRNNYYI